MTTTLNPLILGLGALGAVVVLMLVAFNLRFALFLVGGMLFLSAIALAVDFWGTPYRTWLMPLQVSRSPLYMLAGAAMILGLLVHAGRVSASHVSTQAWMVLVLGIAQGFIRVFHEGFVEGAQTAALAALTVVPAAMIVGASIRRWGDWYDPIRIIGLVGLGWYGCVAVQYVIDPRMLTLGNEKRFIGMLANPQHAAVWVASLGVIGGWLFLNDPARRLRLFWAALIAASLIGILWTGSRTAALMFTVGTVGVMYARLGKVILLLPIAGVVLFAAFKLVQGSNIDLVTERLGSTDDTRTLAWLKLIQDGLANPIFGMGIDKVDKSENGYLYGFASFGAFYLLACFALTILSAAQFSQLFRLRWSLEPQDRAVCDLVLSYIAVFYAGSMFEGYMTARISANMVMLVVITTVGHRLVMMVRQIQPLGGDSFHEYADDAEELPAADHARPLASAAPAIPNSEEQPRL